MIAAHSAMKPRYLLTFSCLAAVLLSGCSSGGRAWTRDGVTVAERDAAYDSCVREARSLTETSDGIDNDIAAGQAGNFGQRGGGGAGGGNAGAVREFLAVCMADQGYQPAR